MKHNIQTSKIKLLPFQQKKEKKIAISDRENRQLLVNSQLRTYLEISYPQIQSYSLSCYNMSQIFVIFWLDLLTSWFSISLSCREKFDTYRSRCKIQRTPYITMNKNIGIRFKDISLRISTTSRKSFFFIYLFKLHYGMKFLATVWLIVWWR